MKTLDTINKMVKGRTIVSEQNEKLLTKALSISVALLITLAGVVWAITNGRVSDHECRINQLEIDNAAIKQSLVTTEKTLAEMRTDLKEILRRTAK